MSTYQDNQRRIVGIDKLEDRVKELEGQAAKSSLPGTRGIGSYGLSGVQNQQAAAGSGLSTGGLDGITNGALDSTLGSALATVAANAAIGSAGSTLDGNAGLHNADDILNGALTGTGDILNSMDGITDPATGKPLRINQDGMFRGPTDRATPDSTGVVDGFYPGQKWEVPNDLGTFVPSAEEAGRAYVTKQNEGISNPIDKLEYGGVNNVHLSADGSHYIADFDFYVVSNPDSKSTQGVTSGACTIGTLSCPASVPERDQWPPSSQTELGKDANGNYISSPSDPSAPPSLTLPHSTLITKSTTTGGYITQKPTTTGGFTIGASDNAGNYTGNVQVFNAQRQNISTISGSQAAMLYPH